MSSISMRSAAGLLAAAGLIAVPFQDALSDDTPSVHSAGDPTIEWGACPDFFPEQCGIAVLHGPPDQPRADVFFRVPADTSLPRHTHTSAERMVLVSGRLRVDYDGHDPAVLETGDYAYGPAALPHSARCLDAGPCVLFIAFNEPVDAMLAEGTAQAAPE